MRRIQSGFSMHDAWLRAKLFGAVDQLPTQVKLPRRGTRGLKLGVNYINLVKRERKENNPCVLKYDAAWTEGK
jgi:hypothetical protein